MSTNTHERYTEDKHIITLDPSEFFDYTIPRSSWQSKTAPQKTMQIKELRVVVKRWRDQPLPTVLVSVFGPRRLVSGMLSTTRLERVFNPKNGEIPAEILAHVGPYLPAAS